jgi:hypothetical protein
MSITVDQVKQFLTRLEEPMSLDEMHQAQAELDRLQAASSDATVQKAIDQARLYLFVKEEQAEKKQKVDELYLTLYQFRQVLKTTPEMTVEQYQSSLRCVSALRCGAEELQDDAFYGMPKSKYLEILDSCDQTLRFRNPTAWKTDLVARAVIIGGVALLFAMRSANPWEGAKNGLLGGLVAAGLEKGLGLIWSGIGWAGGRLFSHVAKPATA